MQKTLLVITIVSLIGCSDNKTPAAVEKMTAGFRTITTKDTNRIYKPGTDTSDYLHYRPLDIDLWYPASASEKDTTISFREILGLLEKRANYYTASTAGTGITQQLAQYFCEGLKCSDSAQLLNFKTATIKNATPVNGKFPLVIYMAAFNGMSYENVTLFEKLARKGFAVASISSIGRFPGDMTMKKEDLYEQIADAIAGVQELKKNSNIDFNKIAIVGYSWGGLAGSILAGRVPAVKALVSLDGSEFHYYGTHREENIDFDDLRHSAEFSTLNINAPYLRLESKGQPPADSIYDFKKQLRKQTHILIIDSAKHEDFGTLPDMVKKSGNCTTDPYQEIISRLTIAFLQEQLQDKKIFNQIMEEETNSNTIRKK